jgi:hypothetical protein
VCSSHRRKPDGHQQPAALNRKSRQEENRGGWQADLEKPAENPDAIDIEPFSKAWKKRGKPCNFLS